MKFRHIVAFPSVVGLLSISPTPTESLGVSVARAQLGPQAIYSLDRAHSSIDFTVPFIGVTRVRGRFNSVRGTLLYDDEDITRSSMTVVIASNSIDTNNDFRDRDLRGNFFHVEQYPSIIFQSQRIERTATGFVAHGTFTMHGVTKVVAIPFEQLHGPTKGIWNMTRVGFAGRLTLNRKDYGVEGDAAWNVPFDLDRRAIGDEVTIELIVQALRVDWRDRNYQSDSMPSIGEIMQGQIEEHGISAALARYEDLRHTSPDSINFAYSELRLLGNRLLQAGEYAAAIEVYRLNTDAYPETPGAFTNLGRAQLGAGDNEAAKSAYEVALGLQPVNTEALELLRQLRTVEPGAD